MDPVQPFVLSIPAQLGNPLAKQNHNAVEEKIREKQVWPRKRPIHPSSRPGEVPSTARQLWASKGKRLTSCFILLSGGVCLAQQDAVMFMGT